MLLFIGWSGTFAFPASVRFRISRPGQRPGSVSQPVFSAGERLRRGLASGIGGSGRRQLDGSVHGVELARPSDIGRTDEHGVVD